MTNAYIVTGTDTGIGKTIVAAMLTLALDARYWKPIQSGTEDGTDRQRVQTLTLLPDDRFVPEQYVLSHPLSPHRASEIDEIEIDTDCFPLPETEGALIVEGAGGLMVPVTRQKLQIDIFAAWGAPLILCARTGLGTINHTLLSVEALRQRNMPLHGLIFVGDDNLDNMRTISDFSGVRILGHVPHLDVIDRDALLRVFTERLRVKDFV
jgi:dethiobiotin synthetase